LRIDIRPVGFSENGIPLFEQNHFCAPYIVFDTAHTGFGVKVAGSKGRTTKRYLLQRRVGNRVVKATIGRCEEMSIKEAKNIALLLGRDMARTGTEAGGKK
jgi:hypothetical protein